MGSQVHMYLETQTARAEPSDNGGMNVKATSQWLDVSQEVIAEILDLPQSR